MTVEEKEERRENRRRRWLRVVGSAALTAIILWLLSREIDFAAALEALATANPLYIVAAMTVTIFTSFLKSERWGLLLATDRRKPAGRDRFRALMLGQFLNLLIFRIGDLARVYELGQRTGHSKARLLGTLVIEKLLDMTVIILTMVCLLPFVVVPSIISNPAGTLSVIIVPALVTMYAVAYQSERFTRLLQQITRYLPDPLEARFNQLIVAGLEGLSALRNRRLTIAIYAVSLLIGAVSILTPYLLFPSLNLPLGVKEAVLLHLVTSVGSLPPTTPARLGVFEGLVIFVLGQMGMADQNLMLSYALLYHGVILIPQLLLGALALAQSRWRKASPQTNQ